MLWTKTLWKGWVLWTEKVLVTGISSHPFNRREKKKSLFRSTLTLGFLSVLGFCALLVALFVLGFCLPCYARCIRYQSSHQLKEVAMNGKTCSAEGMQHFNMEWCLKEGCFRSWHLVHALYRFECCGDLLPSSSFHRKLWGFHLKCIGGLRMQGVLCQLTLSLCVSWFCYVKFKENSWDNFKVWIQFLCCGFPPFFLW